MKTEIFCLPCYLRGVISVLDDLPCTPDKKRAITKELLKEMQSVSFEVSPPENAARVYRKLNTLSGVGDPYETLKLKSTIFAADLLEQLRPDIASFPDPLESAVRMAVAGNILDIAVKMPKGEGKRRLLSALTEPMNIVNLERFRSAIRNAQHILYVLDNCGEAVFDRFLLELCRPKVTIAVRGKPILNDMTRKEIEASGLAAYSLVDTGSMVPGVILADASAEFLAAYEKSDLLIAKGQGNYETLSEEPGPDMFFLLRAKCPAVMRSLGNVPAMSMQLAFREASK